MSAGTWRDGLGVGGVAAGAATPGAGAVAGVGFGGVTAGAGGGGAVDAAASQTDTSRSPLRGPVRRT